MVLLSLGETLAAPRQQDTHDNEQNGESANSGWNFFSQNKLEPFRTCSVG